MRRNLSTNGGCLFYSVKFSEFALEENCEFDHRLKSKKKKNHFCCFAGFIMGWLCVSHQLDSSPCFGFDDNWQVFTQNLCCILLSK